MGIGIQIGEEGIRLGGGENAGDIHPVAQAQKLAVHGLAADDKGIRSCGEDGGRQGVHCFGILGREALVARQHDVLSVGKTLTAGQALQCLATHNDAVSGGQRLEALKVGADAEEKIIIFSNAPVFTDGYDSLHRITSYCVGCVITQCPARVIRRAVGDCFQMATGILSSKAWGS